MRRTIGILLGLAGLLPACAVADTPVWQGALARDGVAAQFVVLDEAGWSAVWQKIGKPAPQDLPAGMAAVAVFAGTKRTSGYQVVFNDRPIQQGGTRIVRYRISAPPADRPVAQVITAPYAVMLVPADHPVAVQEDR